MSYQLEAGESIETGLRRILIEEIHKATKELGNVDLDREKACHLARKRLKKVRAIFRLCRSSLPHAVRRRENRIFRDLGRSLSAARDATVLLECFNSLLKPANEGLTQQFEPLREALQQQRANAAQQLEHGSDLLTAAVSELALAEIRFSELSFSGERFAIVGQGFKKTFRDGTGALRACEKQGSDDRFHELRKRSKDLWYHTRLFELAWPAVFSGYASEAKRLSDLLGEDHDLAVLHQWLGSPDVPKLEKSASALLDSRILNRRHQNQWNALHLARRLYGEQPRSATERLKRAWKNWELERGTFVDGSAN